MMKATLELPAVRSRAPSAAVSSIASRRSSVMRDNSIVDDADGKSVEELQKMLRQERLVRLI